MVQFGLGGPESGGVDVMQVCINGHQITDRAERKPERTQAFCAGCGAKTIIACVECGQKIPGHDWNSAIIGLGQPVPKYCRSCGAAHPWQQAAIANAIEVLEELGLDGGDKEMANAALQELITSTPKAEVSAIRLKRILTKLGKPAYDIGIKVVSDLVSESIRKAYFGK